ncbi:hypothetical protein E8E12_002634 [Didymella heteroderae]|uniref:DNA/RNA-binding domain-containing protein n=1 Tax=Didymella heteroderae TaxID=1769908 RepID=A0A9P4WGS0_9PLEO|nr:hypothetical protein E8E12_002634 [Didymella heteroderae]
MPARMWKHGIHSCLELLRWKLEYAKRQNLESAQNRQTVTNVKEVLFAFIYLAYKMMALLYETVPAFEDTWLECLGDLGRYRMAIEDVDMRDKETWANVAQSWYSRAADKNPSEIYYYCRSMNSVEPFPSARQSVMILFEPFTLDDEDVKPFVYTPNLPIDTLFTGLHALYFTRLDKHWHDQVRQDFMGALDNHIGRVTAKWREQGVHIAVTNISGWFDYGVNSNPLRQLFRLRAEVRKEPDYMVQPIDPDTPLEEQDPQRPKFTEEALLPMLKANEKDLTFCRSTKLTNDTFALVLQRIGDKNVLPHVHVMLSFLATFAAIGPISHLIDPVPWADVVDFLNALIKIENQQSQGSSINESLAQPVFPAEGEKRAEDDLPLPEDWLIRGLIWAEEYLPANWLNRENDDGRYLELASTARRRSIRILRLGCQVSSFDRWISYVKTRQTFELVESH